MGKFY